MTDASLTSSQNKKWTTALWIVFIVFLVALDQVTKLLAIAFLKGQESVRLISGVLELTYVENKGMAFGMLQGRQILFCIFCIVFLLAILYLFIRIPKNVYYMPLIILGAVLAAGALGNFIDRIVRNHVVDFIYFSLIDFPVFNIADIYVTCGGAVLVLLVIFRYKDEDFSFITPKKG